MIENTLQLRSEINAERSALAENLHELELKARALTDWRAQVNRHPLAMVGVALAGGVALAMLVPPRRRLKMRARRAELQPIAGDGNSFGNGVGNGVGNGNANRVAGAMPEPSFLSNPIVARVVGALVAVAAAKAVEMLSDTIPGFSEQLEQDEPAG